MSFALLKKAFGIGKATDEKEFDEFLRVFDGSDAVHIGHLSKLLKKKAVRLLVLKNEDSSVIFDSAAQKDSLKSAPILNVGRQQLNLRDMAFGSYSLSNRLPLLFSTKIHDMSSTGQMLFTRVFSDLDEWRKLYLNSRRNSWVGRGIFNTGSTELKHDVGSYRTLAVCLLINLDWCTSSGGLCAGKTTVVSKPHSRRNFSHLFNTDTTSQTVVQPTLDNSLKISAFSARRFYHMLFEHWTQLSLLLEILTNECAVAVCNSTRNCWGMHNFVPETHCTDVIAKAFNSFLDYFRDLCLPKLSFPIWPTLNVTLSIGSDSLPSYFERSRADCVAYWLNMDPSYCHSLPADCTQVSKDNLADVFVRSCLVPLMIRGNSKEHRSFLSRLLTGILMFHTGWLDGISSKGSCSDSENSARSSSNNRSVHTSLLDQLLTQIGFIPIETDRVSGNIFNCTVISGQSRAYLMALLYFATYFLRFICLTHTQECVPELGQADLFELEQQKRRTRLGGKTRRKSGSATINSSTTNCSGDANDSGISSQEDLTSVVYSASTGSSPTHVSGMALCMTRRLTRDQCRVAEAAAHLVVTREAAAAAAAAGPTSSFMSVGGTRSSHSNDMGLSDVNNSGSGPSNSPRSYRSRYTEVPLLIEKYFDGDEELCSCLPTEIIPACGSVGSYSASLTSPTRSSPGSPYNTLDNVKTSYLPISSQSVDRSLKQVFSSQSHNHDALPSSSSSRSMDGSNLFSIDNMLSSSTCQTDLEQQQQQQQQNPDLFHRSSFQTFVNHSLIAGAVSDVYHSGHVLQATVEQAENFKPRLEENLIQWLTYGPLVFSDFNNLSLNNNNFRIHETVKPNHPNQISSSHHTKHPKWSATGLLINCDTKTVEALTIVQPNLANIVLTKEVEVPNPIHVRATPPVGSGIHSGRDRAKIILDQTDSMEQQPLLVTPVHALTSSVSRRHLQIKAAPLVSRLIEETHMVLETTNCSLMTLKHLESNLQLIYHKSIILTNLLIKEGSSVLQRIDRMMIAAGYQYMQVISYHFN
ncbi:unnamed protein product [Heterobilharzia americana]|nr:unnamed protein product [Heterobilharzia americana]